MSALGVVLQVRDGVLQVLLWQRAKEPYDGLLGPPGRLPGPRRAARGVDPAPPGREGRRPRALPPRAARDAERPRPASRRMAARDRLPRASSPPTSTRPCPRTRPGTRSTRCRRWRSTTSAIALAGRERLRAKLSYTNLGFALAPAEFTMAELRDLYTAALGHEVSATNLKRVLLRRGVLEPTGDRRPSGALRRPAGRALPLPHACPRDHRPVRGASPAGHLTSDPRGGVSSTEQEAAQYERSSMKKRLVGVAVVVASALAAVSLAFAGSTTLKLHAPKTTLAYNKKVLKAKAGKVTIDDDEHVVDLPARRRDQGQGQGPRRARPSGRAASRR